MKIDLQTVTNSDMLTIINQNFTDIENEFQNKVLYRDNPMGEPNTVEDDIDMNGNRIINLPEPVALNEAARLQDVVNSVSGIVPASVIPFAPSGTISANNVQAAINELDSETQDHFASVEAAIDAIDFDLTGPTGSSLVGYKYPDVGSFARTVESKLNHFFLASDFGLYPTNTATDNNIAFNAMMARISALGGGVQVEFDRGTYNFTGNLDITISGFRMIGQGPEITSLSINHPTNDFFKSLSGVFYQGVEDMTIVSSVTRTAGSMWRTNFWRRSYMRNVRIARFFDGCNFEGFEQSAMEKCFLVDPSGAGTTLTFGISGVPAAANFTLYDCFLRGNNDILQDTPVGLTGIWAFNCEAIFIINTDIGQYQGQTMRISPTTRCANIHCVQTFFDGTVNGDNLLMDGVGIKRQFQFTGCWFNGAGQVSPFATNKVGVNAADAGSYYDINFTGCRFFSTSAAGVLITTPQMDFNFVGCVFADVVQNGASTIRSAIELAATATATKAVNIVGCKFMVNNGTADINANANSCVLNFTPNVSGCALNKGMFKPNASLWGRVSGCTDVVNNVNLASANVMLVPPTSQYHAITGTATVNNIPPTYAGHIIVLRPLAASTYVDDASNLRLAGNFVGNSNSQLTLVCEANGEWREVARSAP